MGYDVPAHPVVADIGTHLLDCLLAVTDDQDDEFVLAHPNQVKRLETVDLSRPGRDVALGSGKKTSSSIGLSRRMRFTTTCTAVILLGT